MFVENPQSPAEVAIYTSPWVSGSRAARYFGPVSEEYRAKRGQPLDVEVSLGVLIGLLRETVYAVGGNAVVGLELTVDPYDRLGALWTGVGTGALLVPALSPVDPKVAVLGQS